MKTLTKSVIHLANTKTKATAYERNKATNIRTDIETTSQPANQPVKPAYQPSQVIQAAYELNTK